MNKQIDTLHSFLDGIVSIGFAAIVKSTSMDAYQVINSRLFDEVSEPVEELDTGLEDDLAELLEQPSYAKVGSYHAARVDLFISDVAYSHGPAEISIDNPTPIADMLDSIEAVHNGIQDRLTDIFGHTRWSI